MSTRAALKLLAAALAVAAVLAACVPPRPQPPAHEAVPDTFDPAVWRKTYPVEYAGWAATKDARPTGLSKYKRGGTGGREYDKLSEYPYMSALTSGFGFSVEYNEPRGHWWMLIDQNAIDPARLRTGGACLTCKTPYANKLRAQEGTSYFSLPYFEAVSKLPSKDRYLGVTCVNCHDPKTLALRVDLFTVEPALRSIGMTLPLSSAERRNLVCGQCHCTYTITKAQGHSTNVVYPWAYGKPGDISVEAVIAWIRGNEPRSLEFTQTLTGFKLGYIRHPEYELFSRGSDHYRAGVTCPDCHMPFKIQDGRKVTDHRVGDPLDDPGLAACVRCHPTLSPAQLRAAVFAIQDRAVGVILTAGYSVTQDARLFQILASSPGSASVDASTYAAAKDAYVEAFYRVAYLGAENSVGFHNPSEVTRIGADALAFSQRAEALLRQMLAGVGVTPPPEANLALLRFLTGRGNHALSFQPGLEFRDPSGTAERLFQRNLQALRSGPGVTTPPPLAPSATPATPTP